MKNTITRVDALNYAITAVTNSTEVLTNPDEIVEVLTKIRDQIAKPRKTSDEAKAKAKDKRAKARAALMEQGMPFLIHPLIKGGYGFGGGGGSWPACAYTVLCRLLTEDAEK